MRLYEIEAKADEFGMNINQAIGARRSFLYSQIDWFLNVEASVIGWDVVCKPEIIKLVDELVQLQKDIWRKKKPANKDDVTPEMIARAKNYPVHQLVDFGQSGTATAWCHEDKKPSLTHWKAKNRVSCFPCGKTYDAIDILVQRDGYKFFDAVRYLDGKF